MSEYLPVIYAGAAVIIVALLTVLGLGVAYVHSKASVQKTHQEVWLQHIMACAGKRCWSISGSDVHDVCEHLKRHPMKDN